MTDYVIINGFIKKVCKKQFFEELMIMIILRKRQSHIEGRYKSKKLMTFFKSKYKSNL